MTDRSGWTDEQVNEAVFKAKGWTTVIPDFLWTRGTCTNSDIEDSREIPDYASDWQLCGELLEEMKSAEVSLLYMIPSNTWCVEWVDRMATVHDFESDNPKRAIAEAWLMWKEVEND